MLIKSDENPVGLGYLEIDHRNTVGELPPGVRFNYVERDTYTCTHCNAVVVLNPERIRPRYKCHGCSHLICDGCGAARWAGEPCITMQQIVDEIKERELRKAGILPTEIIQSNTIINHPTFGSL